MEPKVGDYVKVIASASKYYGKVFEVCGIKTNVAGGKATWYQCKTPTEKFWYPGYALEVEMSAPATTEPTKTVLSSKTICRLCNASAEIVFNKVLCGTKSCRNSRL